MAEEPADAYDEPEDLEERSIGNHFLRKGSGDNKVISAAALDIPSYNNANDYAEALHHDGFAVIKNAIAAEDVPRIKAKIDELIASDSASGGLKQWGWKDGEQREDATYHEKHSTQWNSPELLP